MQVYKFGGASIATPERMKALLPIIQYGGVPLIVVVSALGKTTNALEDIVRAAYNGHPDEANSLLDAIESVHNEYAAAVVSPETLYGLIEKLNVFYTEMKWAIDDAPQQPYDYVYDQIVSVGELMSTTIFSEYLNENGVSSSWTDARSIIRTDNTYRDARVDEAFSGKRAKEIILPLFEKSGVVVTQGFIGSTDENASTTLGREGSDYSAALLASFLDADAVSIWKDVEGLKNADPKLFPNTVKIEEITYHEVIEMAYYGAQVIHPKTIKPLQNADIPLYVKCFLDPALKGTVIKAHTDTFVYPPLIVLKKNQTLLEITSKDFDFITENSLSLLYNIFYKNKIKINLVQNAAISLLACVDNQEEKIAPLITALSEKYQIRKNTDVQLLTIRHYSPSVLEELTKGHIEILVQKTSKTIQLVIK